MDGAHPNGKVTAQSPEGPYVPKANSGNGQGLGGLAMGQALF